MTTTFPATIDSYTVQVDNVDDVLAALVNNLQDAMVAVESVASGGNYVITPSVASSNLTVALKTLDGGDPASSDPIGIRIGDDFVGITAALSTTKNAGTNWFNCGSAELATQDVDFFVYLIAETGAAAGVKIGFARIPYARVMGDFSSTLTAATYIAGSYTNKNATDPVTLIGRFNATLGIGGGYLWSIGTAVVINRPIFETRWLTYAPTVTTGSGTITTLGTVSGTYQIVGRNMPVTIDITITTNGTGASDVRATLPITSAGGLGGYGREVNVTGKLLHVQNASTYLSCMLYDNNYAGGDGRRLTGGAPCLRLI